MKIEAKIELSKVNEWNINWGDENKKTTFLKEFKNDMKMAISEQCGVNLSDISIELNLLQTELKD